MSRPSSDAPPADPPESPVFLFFSNRLGCFGSLVLSAVVTIVLVLLLTR